MHVKISLIISGFFFKFLLYYYIQYFTITVLSIRSNSVLMSLFPELHVRRSCHVMTWYPGYELYKGHHMNISRTYLRRLRMSWHEWRHVFYHMILVLLYIPSSRNRKPPELFNRYLSAYLITCLFILLYK